MEVLSEFGHLLVNLVAVTWIMKHVEMSGHSINVHLCKWDPLYQMTITRQTVHGNTGS